MRLLGLAIGLLFGIWGFVSVVSNPGVFGVMWMLGAFAVACVNAYQLLQSRSKGADQ